MPSVLNVLMRLSALATALYRHLSLYLWSTFRVGIVCVSLNSTEKLADLRRLWHHYFPTGMVTVLKFQFDHVPPLYKSTRRLLRRTN